MLSIIIENVPEGQKRNSGRNSGNLTRISVEFTPRRLVVGAGGNGEDAITGLGRLFGFSLQVQLYACHLRLFPEPVLVLPCPFLSSRLHPVS